MTIGKLISLDEHRPHGTGVVSCERCGYGWVAVWPESATHLDCPRCLMNHTVRVDMETDRDCLRAAVATLMGLPLYAVPDTERAESRTAQELIVNGFLQDFGLTLWWVYLERGAFRWGSSIADIPVHLVSGPSPRGGEGHVIVRGPTGDHDPHPSRAGLAEEREYGFVTPLPGKAVVG